MKQSAPDAAVAELDAGDEAFDAVAAGWRTGTAGYLSFGPMAQCVVHALKGLACRASPSRKHAEVTENIKYFSMGPKLRHPAVHGEGRRDGLVSTRHCSHVKLHHKSIW